MEIKPIRASEARGDSKPLSAAEYASLAGKGTARLDAMRAAAPGTPGLDNHWSDIKSHAAEVSSQPWGGATYSPRTGRPVSPSRGFAVSARFPSQEQVRLPENASHEQLGAAMDQAKASYHQLGHAAHHLGVFHDDEAKTIDIDPVVITRSRQAAMEVGAATHATGGAYDFRTGNAAWVPHVRDTAEERQT